MRTLIDACAIDVLALARPGRTLGACGGLAALALVLPVFENDLFGSATARAQERPRDQICARWDALASEAIVHLVHGKDDVLVRQVGDAVFRMRRARRTCQLGWAQLACQDYRAIVQSVSGFSVAHRDLGCASSSTTTAQAPADAERAESTGDTPPPLGALARAQMSCAELFAAYPPIDEALGNLGGDPFGYHVFGRDAELATLRESSEACLNRTVAIAGQ